jgi:hypothetical protein
MKGSPWASIWPGTLASRQVTRGVCSVQASHRDADGIGRAAASATTSDPQVCRCLDCYCSRDAARLPGKLGLRWARRFCGTLRLNYAAPCAICLSIAANCFSPGVWTNRAVARRRGPERNETEQPRIQAAALCSVRFLTTITSLACEVPPLRRSKSGVSAGCGDGFWDRLRSARGQTVPERVQLPPLSAGSAGACRRRS